MAFLDPFELLEEHVDDHIVLSRFNYLNGQFPTDTEGKVVSFPDKKLISSLNVDVTDIPDYIKQYNGATTVAYKLWYLKLMNA